MQLLIEHASDGRPETSRPPDTSLESLELTPCFQIRSLGVNPSPNQVQEVTDRLVSAMGGGESEDKASLIPLDTIELVVPIFVVSQVPYN